MRVSGSKLRGYDAVYEKCLFDVDVRGGIPETAGRVLTVTDINSGMTFVFETDDDICTKKPVKTRVWRSRENK